MTTRAAAAPGDGWHDDSDDVDDGGVDVGGVGDIGAAAADDSLGRIFDDPLDADRTWFAMPWHKAAPCNCDRDALARAVKTGPALGAVVAAAQRAAGVADNPTASWRRRSRIAAIIPSVTIRAGNSESWRDVTDPTVSHAVALGGSLAWRFERLVFDPNEPRFAAHDLARRRERRRIAHVASRGYFRWLEARAAVLARRQSDDDTGWRIVLMQATADLDALTDGWFSHLTKSVQSW